VGRQTGEKKNSDWVKKLRGDMRKQKRIQTPGTQRDAILPALEAGWKNLVNKLRDPNPGGGGVGFCDP